MFNLDISYAALLVLTCMHLHLCSGRALNAFVRHYEPLSYDPVDVHGRATRWKRSASRGVQEQSVEVAFRALERDFRLRLVRDRSSFSDDFSLVTNNGPVDVNLDHLYSGHVVGSPDESRVVGAIMDGVFVGRIAVLGEEYHVERASRFFPSANGSSSPAFHSVLYSARDVVTPGGGGPLCGLHGTAEEAMHTLRSRYRRGTQNARMHRSKRSLSPPDLGAVDGRDAWLHVYTASNDQRLQNARIPLGDTGAVVYSPFLAKGAHGERSMPGGRQPTLDVAGGRQNEPRLKRVCNLEINVDHTLYSALVSDMNGDQVKARNELTNMISTHTAAASEMFGETDFGGIVDISFAVQKVKLDDSNDCEGVLRETNLLCRENLDGAHLLFVLSRTNHDGFCASVLWTHRVLPDGMLGIAFVAEPEGDSGGICETYRHAVVKKKLDAYDGPLSLNTAVVTFQNHNGRVPQRTSHITFAHELGHNFGSSHDPEPECAPGGSQGNYIMYADAQPGVDPNNRKFSPCSIANITVILRRLFSGEGTRDNCLQAPRGPLCGNMIREGDEQCDCGYTPSACRDRCCRPRRHAKPCTLAPYARCSPSNGACCTENCTLRKTWVVCRPEDDCRYKAYCDGRRAECPLAAPKPDGTPCNRGTQLCRSGECRLSVCRRYHLEPCFLTGRFVTSADQCLVACREPVEGSECMEACRFTRMRDLCHKHLEPGAACADLRGYCDVFQRCRLIDAEGPLAALRQLVFGRQGVPNALLEYWYVAAAGLVLSAVLTLAVIRACAVHVPSSNPRRCAQRKLSETVRHPLDFIKDLVRLTR